ncbi:MAG: type VI secretion system tube protein TssD [Terracidiphilus sp.]
MPYYASISLKVGSSSSKGGPVHKISYGGMAITPSNLGSTLSQVRSQYDAGSGALTGRRQHPPITIVRETDSSSPLLWQALCTNETLQTVDINIVQRPSSGKGEVVVSRITLTNAQISKVNRYTPLQPQKPGSHVQQVNTSELERFDFKFQKITYTNVAGSTSATDDWLQNP